MTLPRLSNPEMRIMEALWTDGDLSVREIQESFPAEQRLSYSAVLTMVRRLEAKKALRQVKKIGTASSYEAAIPRDAALRRVIEDFLTVREAEKRLHEVSKKDRKP